MKPRVISTYKVLAVALATVSCGKPTSDESRAQTAASAAAPLPPVPLAPSASAAAVPIPPEDDEADPKLLALRTELDAEKRENALSKQAHYRPLCDKDGYPLVGNLHRKGRGLQPSELCALVRTNQKPS